MKQNYTLTPQETPIQLVQHLADRLGCSLRKAKRLLDERKVFVNRRRVWMARHELKPGDVVEIATSAPPTDCGQRHVAVLFENADYLLIDKPHGILSNGAKSVETLLRKQLAEPGLTAVHRLDSDTSGCLLVARAPAAFDRAVALFRAGKVLKIYQAIVRGRPTAPQRTITKKIEGDSAITHWTVLSGNENAAHLRIKIDTGRTHQIRKHLSGIGHPVLGDREYFRGRMDDERLRSVPRQMLHASVFQAPLGAKGAVIRVTAPLPEDFKKTLKTFGL